MYTRLVYSEHIDERITAGARLCACFPIATDPATPLPDIQPSTRQLESLLQTTNLVGSTYSHEYSRILVQFPAYRIGVYMANLKREGYHQEPESTEFVDSQTTLSIPITVHLKDALRVWCEEHDNVPMAAIVRQAIIDFLGYDRDTAPVIARRKKYNSNEERKKVYAEKARAQRKLEKRLKQAYEDQKAKEEKLKSIKALENSLRRNGIDPNT